MARTHLFAALRRAFRSSLALSKGRAATGLAGIAGIARAMVRVDAHAVPGA